MPVVGAQKVLDVLVIGVIVENLPDVEGVCVLVHLVFSSTYVWEYLERQLKTVGKTIRKIITKTLRRTIGRTIRMTIKKTIRKTIGKTIRRIR